MNKLVFCIIFSLINSINVFSQDHRDVYVFERNGKKGLVNNEMKIIAEAKYESLGGYTISYRNKVFQDKLFDIWRLGDSYSVGSYIIFKYEGKFGVMNLDGEWIIEPKYKEIKYTAVSGIFRFKENDKFGLLNEFAKEFLKPKYEHISPEDNQNIIVKEGGDYFLIDYKGSPISDKFSHRIFSYDYKTKIFIFTLNRKYGYKKINGNIVFDTIFYDAYSFFDSTAKVRKKENGNFGFVNKNGKIIMHPKYENIYSNGDFTGYFIIGNNHKYGLLDKDLKLIISPKYDEIGAFSDGYAFVKKDGKYGFIDKTGKIIIPIMYNKVNDFSEGLAPVKLNEKWGAVNMKNEVIIDFKFGNTIFKPFSDGLAAFGNPFSEMGYINLKGEIQINPIYEGVISKFIDGVAIVKLKGDTYLINKESKKFLLKSEKDEPIIEIRDVKN